MTVNRFQLALNVKNLDESIAYFSKMFDTPVNKQKPGYANFAIANPPLKLVLFELPDAKEQINHLGVEAFDQQDVDVAITRLKAAGIAEAQETGETCCFATQNKVWSTDPMGNKWEWYRVLEDSDTFFAEQTKDVPKESRQKSPALCC